MLTGGSTKIATGPTTALQAFKKLAAGDAIDALGTFGPLGWNPDGAVIGGTLEMWCIGLPAGTPVFQSSGLTFDIMTLQPTGKYTQCQP
jgi:hypothetical protein